MGTLRLLLAISVVVFHVGGLWGLNLVGGKVAVEAFFMISGFYMALILNEKYSASAKGYYLFITNRALRLYPVYWCVWLLTLAFCFFAYYFLNNPLQLKGFESYGALLSMESWIQIVLANLSLIGQDFFFFLQLDHANGGFVFTSKVWESSPHVFNFLLVPQAWSISLELLFYVIAPFLIRKPLLVIATIISSFLLRMLFFGKGYQSDPWTYRFFFFELQFFFMGALAYFFYTLIKRKSILNYKWIDFSLFIAVILFTLAYQSLPSDLYILPKKFLVFNDSFFVFPFKFWVYCTLLFVAIPFVFRLSKSHRRDRAIGELSYPIYISHMLVVFVFEVSPLAYLEDSVRTLTICLATIGFSILLNKYIAEPIDLIRQTRTTKKIKRSILATQAA